MCLFIGGPMDGRQVAIEDNRQYIQVATEKPFKAEDGVSINVSPTFDRELFTYRREKLACPYKEYDIFVPESFDCEDLIETLINGYKPNDSKTVR